jgi:hypothetical protein
VDIEQDDPWAQVARRRQRLGGVPCLADDLKTFCLEQGASRRTEADVVVDDEDARPHPSSVLPVRAPVIRACPDTKSRERSDGNRRCGA